MGAHITTILAVCGGISVIGGAIAVMAKFIAPVLRLHKEVSEHSKQIQAIETNLEEDHQLLEASEKADRLICRALVDITGHMIHGDHVEEMKETQKEILDFLSK
ncbi:MAG: hypothetical protein AB7D36_10605 [Oscillospiraceae bacterium]